MNRFRSELRDEARDQGANQLRELGFGHEVVSARLHRGMAMFIQAEPGSDDHGRGFFQSFDLFVFRLDISSLYVIVINLEVVFVTLLNPLHQCWLQLELIVALRLVYCLKLFSNKVLVFFKHLEFLSRSLLLHAFNSF